jgi:hypothetical protein
MDSESVSACGISICAILGEQHCNRIQALFQACSPGKNKGCVDSQKRRAIFFSFFRVCSMHFFVHFCTEYDQEQCTEIKEPMHNMAQIYANTFKRVLQGILKKQKSLDLDRVLQYGFCPENIINDL